jgi:hypothetical protein
LQGFEYIQKIEKKSKGQWADFQRQPGSVHRGVRPMAKSGAAHGYLAWQPMTVWCAWARSATQHSRSAVVCTLSGAASSPMREGGRLHAWSGGARLGRRGGRGGCAYRHAG